MRLAAAASPRDAPRGRARLMARPARPIARRRSRRIFGSNVMVSVATQESRNPMQTMARALHVPQAEIISSSLALPMKLMFPRDMPGRLAAMFAPSPPGGQARLHVASFPPLAPV